MARSRLRSAKQRTAASVLVGRIREHLKRHGIGLARPLYAKGDHALLHVPLQLASADAAGKPAHPNHASLTRLAAEYGFRPRAAPREFDHLRDALKRVLADAFHEHFEPGRSSRSAHRIEVELPHEDVPSGIRIAVLSRYAPEPEELKHLRMP